MSDIAQDNDKILLVTHAYTSPVCGSIHQTAAEVDIGCYKWPINASHKCRSIVDELLSRRETPFQSFAPFDKRDKLQLPLKASISRRFGIEEANHLSNILFQYICAEIHHKLIAIALESI